MLTFTQKELIEHYNQVAQTERDQLPLRQPELPADRRRERSEVEPRDEREEEREPGEMEDPLGRAPPEQAGDEPTRRRVRRGRMDGRWRVRRRRRRHGGHGDHRAHRPFPPSVAPMT